MTQFPGCVSFKVSDTPATVLHPGCTVKMSNLKSEAGKAVNGKEGVLGTFDAASERWVVTIDGVSKKYRRDNLGFVRAANGHNRFQLILCMPGHPDWEDSEKNTVTAGSIDGGEDHGKPAVGRRSAAVA